MHPSDSRANEIAKKFPDKAITFSDPSVERVDVFLSKVKSIIAGDSGIHFDAVAKGKLSFTLNSWSVDYYGFVKEELVILAENLQDFIHQSRNDSVSPRISSIKKFNADHFFLKDIKLKILSTLILNEKERSLIVDKYMVYDTNLASFVYIKDF